MDYTNIIIAIGSVTASVISLAKILGKKFDKIDSRFDKIDLELKTIRKEAAENKEELRKEAAENKEELRKEAAENKKDLQKEINQVDRRLIRLEDRLEFSNKVVYIQHEEKKKESK